MPAITEDTSFVKDVCSVCSYGLYNRLCMAVHVMAECIKLESWPKGPAKDQWAAKGRQSIFSCHTTLIEDFCSICSYKGYTLAPDGRHCQDVNECSTPANNCKFLCKNLIGTFMCICPEGYQQVGMIDDCKDINECATNPNICEHGRCINTKGSYRCECYEGFEPSRDGKECLDRRKGYCFRQLIGGMCSTASDALNQVTKQDCCCTMGLAWGPMCEHCPRKGTPDYDKICLEAGFSIDGLDIDECQTMPNLCRNGKCINTMGSYRCICDKGFKPDHSGTRCIDVNECEQSPSPCKFTCQNTEGSYRCSCPLGYTLNPDGLTCRDLDECATGQHNCRDQCVNTQGSFVCTCAEGYNDVGGRCLDVNECAEQSGLCAPIGTCINTMGSFKCICPRGYTLDSTGTQCIPTDECGLAGTCEEGCESVGGDLQCGCPDGYQLHLFYNQCVDDDECGDAPCGTADCENTLGSYHCLCPSGYSFSLALAVCVQTGDGCSSSSCSFGCNDLGDIGLSCDCPSGFIRIGSQNLCTVNSFIAGPKGVGKLGRVPKVDARFSNHYLMGGHKAHERGPRASCDQLPGVLGPFKGSFGRRGGGQFGGGQFGGGGQIAGGQFGGSGGQFGGGSGGQFGGGQGGQFGGGQVSGTQYTTYGQSQYDLGGVPTFPIGQNDPYGNNENIISTEGCFSCKFNGQGRRRRSLFASYVETNPDTFSLNPMIFHAANESHSKEEVVLVHANNQTHKVLKRSLQQEFHRRDSIARKAVSNPIILKLALNQTKHRTRIIKLQPATKGLKKNVKYEIKYGNEDNVFDMTSKHGVSALHFKHRLHHPESFDLEITGTPIDYSKLDDLVDKDSELDINLRIIVSH
ncbi:unnamed protein product, partial [Meganyctiphanes norvegica]